MKRDFTLKIYKDLLHELFKNQYTILSFENYLTKNHPNRIAVIRHDVDKLPKNSLKIAQIEASLGIKSTYYFRIVPQSNYPEIIRKIVELGHEIGYHYEDLALAKGNKKMAISSFQQNLSYFRQFYPVKTICMHGSPMTNIDNRDIWKDYDYRDYDIIGEPFFDLDFNRFFYLTDTGRCWNGTRYSVRDKVNNSFGISLKTTYDIISSLESGILPDKVHLTTHPQRWTDAIIPWITEYFVQNAKNLVKLTKNKLIHYAD